jgi:hypothetical protein
MPADLSLVALTSPVERISSLEVGHGLVVGTEVPPRAGRTALGGHLLKPPLAALPHPVFPDS